MSNQGDNKLATVDNQIDIKTVTQFLLNTHCIVCGRGFQMPRMSKLYCSPRCKQFGYNHKAEINQALNTRERGINPKPMLFIIDEYIQYSRKQKLLKRYRELEKKGIQWELADQEIKLKDEFGINASNYLWDCFTGKKLTEEEENELYDGERELGEELMELNLVELSLEQWSFIKSLHPTLDEIALIQVISSLSKEFIGHLNLRENDANDCGSYLVIKNKFLNHCNLIASGVIKFEKKGQKGSTSCRSSE